MLLKGSIFYLATCEPVFLHMAVEKITIEKFMQLAKRHPVLDVRSPAEYSHAHLPGAVNMPLFDDEERKVVGTAYKQQSREEAIKIGLDFFGPKMRPMVEKAEKLLKEVNADKTLLIYCWRGGMRSAGVAWLMDLYGFKVFTLSGGYKTFRNFVLHTFQKPFDFHILGGYTGSGKTEVLKQLKQNGETVVDLEEIAVHKGSAFGNIGLPKQPSQEMFENILALKLSAAIDSKEPGSSTKNFPIWLEDESQRIGLVNIPHDLWNVMRNAPVYFLNIPFEERLDHLVEEYGQLDKEKVKDAILRIHKRLGPMETKNAVTFWDEGNIKECFRILLKYYDKYYIKGLHNREQPATLIKEIHCQKVDPNNAEKLSTRPVTL